MSKWLAVFEAVVGLIGPVLTVLAAGGGKGTFSLKLTVADAAGNTLDTVGPVNVTV